MAIGAAEVPPWPAPTSITATATCGFSAGAKATNQAVVFFGSWAASAVGTQLGRAGLARDRDARDRGGAARAAADDGDHHVAHLAGDLRADHALARGCGARHARLDAHAAVGDRRADRGHPERRREVLVLADRARADGEAVLEVLGGRDRARLGRGDVRLLVEAEGSAAATSRLAPSLAPSGPKTELQECANEFDEAAAAGLVARVAQPDAGQRRGRAHRIGARRLARRRAWSAAAAVMILNEEPGGWGAETARPGEREHRSRRWGGSRRRRRACRPARLARCVCSPRRIVVWIERPRRPGMLARSRGRRSAARRCGARRGGRRRCARARSACRPPSPAIEAPVGSEFSSRPPAS